jgi:CRISPR/Cas system CMR subunit Cmr4 (Cas7 group RAMP superfamily)
LCPPPPSKACCAITFNQPSRGRPKRFGDTDQAGAWVFTDLRILCLPVRSFFGVFAYATCPLILERLRRHAEAFGITGFENLSVAVNGTQIALTRDSALHKDGKVYLEDLDLAVKTGQQVDTVAQAIADKLQPRGASGATLWRASRWSATMCSPS